MPLIQSVFRQMAAFALQIINSKKCQRKWPWTELRCCAGICLGKWGKPQISSGRVFHTESFRIRCRYASHSILRFGNLLKNPFNPLKNSGLSTKRFNIRKSAFFPSSELYVFRLILITISDIFLYCAHWLVFLNEEEAHRAFCEVRTETLHYTDLFLYFKF